MTQRRQALRPDAAAATSFFLAVILAFFLTPPSFLAKVEPASSGANATEHAGIVLLDDAIRGALFVSLLMLLGAITLWQYHRRDHTSPRRIGRRI